MNPIVAGHRVGNAVYDFPHRCPGDACAIAAFLLAKHVRATHYRVESGADSSRIEEGKEKGHGDEPCPW
jgi:hypothetical protein